MFIHTSVDTFEIMNASKEISKDGPYTVTFSDPKETHVQHATEQRQSQGLTSITSKENFIKKIQKMYPDMNCGRLSSSITFSEDWVRDKQELLKKHSVL